MGGRYGRWETIGDLPEGGQGRLYRVVDTKEEFPGEFVLKRLKNPGRIERFKREIEAVKLLDHRNVLRIVEFDLTSEKPYYVAEYCKGGSLETASAEEFRADVSRGVHVLLPIVDALCTAHESGVVHRDVKPANILFRSDGTPVLGDFGICYIEANERITLSDEAVGSLNYIAPEMESGRHGAVTGAVDVYALGKVLYWIVSGGKIFSREDHRGSGHYLPELLDDQRFEHLHTLLDGMIVEDPTKRHAITQLSLLMTKTVDLIEGRFTPLRPWMKPQCRFCGIGRYDELRTVQSGYVDWLGGINLRVLRCTHCGHLELFHFAGIENMTWWDNKGPAPNVWARTIPPAVPTGKLQADLPSTYRYGGVDWPLTENFWAIVRNTSVNAFVRGTASPTLLDAAIGDPLCGNRRCRHEIWPYVNSDKCPTCGTTFQLGLKEAQLIPEDALLRLKRDVYAEARAAYMRGEL